MYLILISPKLLRDILLNDRESVKCFLSLSSVLFLVVFLEVRNVFWMREVFLFSIYAVSRLVFDSRVSNRRWELGESEDREEANVLSS